MINCLMQVYQNAPWEKDENLVVWNDDDKLFSPLTQADAHDEIIKWSHLTISNKLNSLQSK